MGVSSTVEQSIQVTIKARPGQGAILTGTNLWSFKLDKRSKTVNCHFLESPGVFLKYKAPQYTHYLIENFDSN